MKTNKQTTQPVNTIRLPILESDRDRARTLSQQQSNTLAQYNSYLNNACLTTFVDWFKDWIPEDFKYHVENSESLASKWEFVNGTVIQLEDTRIILVPCDELEAETFEISQEWVDIPSWNGDYYLPIEVSLGGEEDECWIEICGFTTHRQVKANRMYDAYSRTYVIDRKDLIENMEVMLRTMALNVKVEVPSLPTVVAAEAKKSMEELGKPSIYSPRLHLPFEKWGALIENKTYRQQLFDLRMGKVVAEAMEETKPVKKAINLRNWWQDMTDLTFNTIANLHNCWQTYESLFSETVYAEGFRSRGNLQMNSTQEIISLISLLQKNQSVDVRSNAAKLLGKIGFGNSQAIQALSDILQNEYDLDSETRAEAISSLKKIDLNTSNDYQARAKLIDFGMNLEDFKAALVIATIPSQQGTIHVDLCIKSLNPSIKLPPHIKLSVLKRTGELLSDLENETRSDARGKGLDDILELSNFRLKPGTFFRVQVSYKDRILSEDFIA